MKISLFCIAYNEFDRVKHMGDWARAYADELILVDDFSTDGTRSRTHELKFDKIYLSPKNYGYCEKHQQRAREMCEGDWIFFFDADEHIPEHITREMVEKCIDVNKNCDAIALWMTDYLNGDIHAGGQQCFKYRLFKNVPYVKFPAELHTELTGYRHPVQCRQLEFYHWRTTADINEGSERYKKICLQEISDGKERAKRMYWDLKRHYNWSYHPIEDVIKGV